MIILAIDSSGASASAAVTDGEKLLSLFVTSSPQKHSATLMPMVESTLKAAGKNVAEVDLFAVNAGPGSFTGVRIGVSLVKGLAFGSGKPVVSVSSLEALAYNLAGFGGVACPVMDARRGQFYNALFRGGERLTPDRLISADELKSELERIGCEARFAGDGYALASETVITPQVRETPAVLRVSNAYSTAVCGLRSYLAGENVFTDATVVPIYLRPSQAERERNEKLKGAE